MERKKKKMRKGILTDGEDRIRNLPESLIHHILSFLLMRDVIRTCLLSKQWRNIWKSAPVLSFGKMRRPRSKQFVDQSLGQYEGQKIKKLQIHLLKQIDHSCLTSSVRFAVNHGVEELDVFYKYFYHFPKCLSECLELRVLRLSGPVRSPTSISFTSLTELHLSNFDLDELDTSACPMLQVLTLECACDDLDIYAPNPKLVLLKITELDNEYKDNTCLTLYAPNLQSIEFNGAFRSLYDLIDISSVKTATVELLEPDDGIHETEYGISKWLVELLTNFTHVQSLKLCQTCIQILAYGETIGLEIPSFSASCLELRTNLSEPILIGIASLLRASRCIERLTINMNYSTLPDELIFKDHDINTVNAWESLEHALSVELALNTIFIQNYPGCNGKWSNVGRAPNTKEFLEYCDVEIKLVEVLLKCCEMLKKMNISIMKLHTQPMKSQLLYCLTKKLLIFPRASRKAEVRFS